MLLGKAGFVIDSSDRRDPIASASERLRLQTAAIIVTFEPDMTALRAVLSDLGPGLALIYVVNNGAEWSDKVRDELPRNVEYVQNDSNLGIAAAQNLGVIRALRAGFGYVLFLDDDSSFTIPIATGLMKFMLESERVGRKVGAVGPQLSSFIDAGADASYLEEFIPSSGSLISAATLFAVGEFREDYFIDHVDREWGIRAARAGHHSYQLVGLSVPHQLADAAGRAFGKERRFHSNPARAYYLVRNDVLLWRDLGYSSSQRRRQGVVLLKWCITTLIAGTSRWARARMMILGFADGMRGRAGRLGAVQSVRLPLRGFHDRVETGPGAP